MPSEHMTRVVRSIKFSQLSLDLLASELFFYTHTVQDTVRLILSILTDLPILCCSVCNVVQRTLINREAGSSLRCDTFFSILFSCTLEFYSCIVCVVQASHALLFFLIEYFLVSLVRLKRAVFFEQPYHPYFV